MAAANPRLVELECAGGVRRGRLDHGLRGGRRQLALRATRRGGNWPSVPPAASNTGTLELASGDGPVHVSHCLDGSYCSYVYLRPGRADCRAALGALPAHAQPHNRTTAGGVQHGRAPRRG